MFYRFAVAGSHCLYCGHQHVISIDRAKRCSLARQRKTPVLKVLLKQREADQRQMAADILDNVRRLIVPLVERLRWLELPAGARALLARLDERLVELTQPFLRRLSNAETVLLPQETEFSPAAMCIDREHRFGYGESGHRRR